MIDLGLSGAGGFNPQVAAYLAPKYGHDAATGPAAKPRVLALLAMLSERLLAQQAAGSDYLIGSALTAPDIHLAAAMAIFSPLAPALCPMRDSTRAVFEDLDAETAAALQPILLNHRDRIYARHLETPLKL